MPSRDQYDPNKGVLKKIHHQGSLIMDADLNEMNDILILNQSRYISAMSGGASVRFGDGFKVIGTGASLQVTIKAGYGAFVVDDDLAIILKLENDFTLAGFTAPPPGRTDYVYLDILRSEVTAADDPNIVNPMAGEESCTDIRYTYTFSISENSEPSSPPADHTYVTIAKVAVDQTVIDVNRVIPLINPVNQGIVEGAQNKRLLCSTFEIGDWDMDTDASKEIFLVTKMKPENIRSVSVIIRDNTGAPSGTNYDFAGYGGTVGINSAITFSPDIYSCNLSLTRPATPFDSTNFNSTSYNRGWVTIWYEE